MSGAGRAGRATTRATGIRGVASRILRALAVSPAFQGSGAPFTGYAGRAATFAATLTTLLALTAPGASATTYVDSYIGNPSAATGTTGGLFDDPGGVAVEDLTGAVYVVDRANNRVQQFDAANNFVRAWGTDVISAGAPNDISSSAFEVCDTEHPTTPNSAADCKQGGSGTGVAGEVSSPQGVAVNQATGHVYVTDQGNLRVQEFTAAGEFVRAWGLDVITNAGTPANSNGTGFEVCDTQHPTTPNTPADCQAGTGGSGGGAFAPTFAGYPAVVPAGGSASNAGNVLVADPGNQRVQEFTSTGSFVRTLGFDVVQPGGTGEQIGAPVNERQTVTAASFVGPIASGTFTLTFNGQTTGPLVYNASPSAIQAALEALPSIGAGGVIVSTGPVMDSWTVEFSGALAGIDVAPLVGDASNLDDGFCGPGVCTFITVDTTQAGGPGPAYEICTIAAECKAGGAGNTVGKFANNEPKRVAADAAGAIYTTESTGNFRAQKFSGPSLAPALFGDAILSSNSSSNAPSDLTFDAGANRMLVVAARTLPASACGVVRPQALIYELTTSGDLTDTHGRCSAIYQSAGVAAHSASGRLYLPAAFVATGASTFDSLQRVWVLDDDGTTPAVATINPAADVTSSGADLSAMVNPNSVDNTFAPTLWKIQYSRNGVDWSTASSGSIGVANTTPVTVAGSVDGLSPNTTYRIRVLTQKPFGNLEVPSAELTLLTDAVLPEIRNTAVQSVAPTAATVSARINPHGTPTSYRFEWGEQGSFDHVIPSPDASIGSGPDFVFVAQRLTGLRPGVTYQYRAVAISASEGPAVGPTRTFTTPAQQFAGPVGRAFELVSPADKVGGSGVGTWYEGVGAHGNTGVPAYEGDRFASSAYLGASLVDGGFSYATDWAFGERTSVGWVNRPAFGRPGGFATSEYAKLPLIDAVSDDLSLTSWSANSQIELFKEQAEEFGTFMPNAVGSALRDWDSGSWEILAPLAEDQQGPQGYFAPTVAAAGGYVLAGGQVRGVAGSSDPTHPGFVGGPGDLVCVVIDNNCNGNVYLDDVTAGLSDSFPGAGVRSLVNVCTGAGSLRTTIPSVVGDKITAEACPGVEPGRSARLVSPRGASIAAGGMAPGHISADGSRAFFMSPDHINANNNNAACSGTGAVDTACPPQLYVRQRNVDGSIVTRWISQSAVSDQDASLMAAAIFEGATPDGDKVFFRTAAPLTADDPNRDVQMPGGVKDGDPDANSVDLYMYDMPDGPDGDPSTADGDPAGGVLTRISAGPNSDGDGNVVTGPVIADGSSALRALGEDGSSAYFVTAAPLPGVPAPANGTITSPGGDVGQTATKNLYAYGADRPLAQRWRFVARLPATSPLGACAARGSRPDRDALLAGGAGTGVGGGVQKFSLLNPNCVRVVADGSFISFFTDGRLTGDDPDGASGDVYAYDADADDLALISSPQGGIGGSYECVTEDGGDSGVGTRCHGDPFISANGTRAPLNLISNPADPADRTVFFESASRLVPEDHNDVYDVYQWRNGKLSLISTGAAGADDALYRGNDRTGRNVYVTTRDALTWQDHDKVLDVYVARVDGGIPQPDAPPVCSLVAGTCQASPAGGVAVETPSAETGGENAASGRRMRLAVARPSARARGLAARSGVLSIRVRSDAAGTASVTVMAKVGKRVRAVGRSSASFNRAGTRTVKVSLSRTARKPLSSKAGLRVRVTVTAPEARSQSLTVLLRRTGR